MDSHLHLGADKYSYSSQSELDASIFPKSIFKCIYIRINADMEFFWRFTPLEFK